MMKYYLILFLLLLVVTFYIKNYVKYVKNLFIYYPDVPKREKYKKFYQRLLYLVESENYVSNFIIKTSDDFWLDTVLVRNPDTDKCIIIFHGNSGNITTRFWIIKFLYNFASVVIFDYRSFGRSSGSIVSLSDESIQKDAEAIWEFTLMYLKFRPNNISLFGESFGCLVAIKLAAKISKFMNDYYYPHSLICIAPFYSVKSIINVNLSRLGLGFIGKIIPLLFVRSEYDPKKFIKDINNKIKIVIAHSQNNEMIPYDEGWKLYQKLIENHKNSKFVKITGPHNNIGLTDQCIYTIADIFND